MVRGLARNGEVDLVVPTEWPPEIVPPPQGVDLIQLGFERTGRVERVRRWLTSGVPRIMLNRTMVSAGRAVAGFDHSRYDVTYVSHLDVWWFLRDVLPGPIVVDLDNLEDLATRANRKVRPSGRGAAVWGKWLASQPVEMIDERRFTRWQRECSSAVDVVTLCSDLDVRRSGFANAVSIPNGAEVSAAPRDRRRPPGPDPQLAFIGLMTYGPNADGAHWFADEVLPLVRREIPGATFRVVGRGGETLERLRGRPDVVVTGGLDDLQPEIDRADVAVVPIRYGAGTRLKVVEALGNHIPVVTTTTGCEGIAVSHDRTALIADDAAEFARQVVRAVRDEALRTTLVDEGAELYDREYRWSSIGERLASLMTAVAEGRSADWIADDRR
jgi:glycosyltransferase involved in cell wall biosynthesis